MGGFDDWWVGKVEGVRVWELRVEVGEYDFLLGVSVFCLGGVWLWMEVMVDFIEDYCEEYGVELICRVLLIVLLMYYEYCSKCFEFEWRSGWVKWDEEFEVDILWVWEDSYGGVYGVWKVWW